MHRRPVLAWLGLAPAAWLGAAPVRAASNDGAARRIALVIGNAEYAQAPLANPENDARLVAGTLKSLGFEISMHLNLKVREFRRVLRDFGRRMDDDDSASVFYYAGHGMQIDRRNYLLPVDLNLRDEGEVKDEAIDLEETLLGRIDRVRPRARIFIIDACRDNPFGDRPRAPRSPGGLAEMAAPGALIAFSAAPGRTAEDGPPGTNSIYCRLLAQEMRVEGLEVEEMLKNVRVKVLRETHERQLPWVNTSMVVNFVFNPAGKGVALATAPATVPAVAVSPVPARAGAAPRSLRLSLQAERSLNTDRQQGSASLALRVYVLRDGQAIQRASFDSLYDNDEATLGAALLRREIVHLRPGESREMVLTLGDEARYVAVVAAYRELERSQWRTVLALPVDDTVPPARLSAQARQVQLTWAR
jgi:type VI secretion system VasD/TssJ family lipoprotein